MVKALLIDLDGTLADSMPSLCEVFIRFLARYGVKSSVEEFNCHVGATLWEIILHLKKQYLLPDSTEDLLAYYQSLLVEAYATQVTALPWCEEALMLAKEKELKLAVVTAANKEVTTLFLQAQKWQCFFDLVVCAEAQEPGKPNPALYLRALSCLKVQATETVVIEDSTAGVKAGLAAGSEVFWITASDCPCFSAKVRQVKGWKEIGQWLKML